MNALWTIRIDRMEIHLPVGIYADELASQPMWVSLTASGMASATPSGLDECFDYEPLCHWLMQVWPGTPHTPLLETRINQLLAFVFDLDQRVNDVWVGLYKQRVSHQALAVGMERGSTRAEFEAQQCQTATKQCVIRTINQESEQYAATTQ